MDDITLYTKLGMGYEKMANAIGCNRQVIHNRLSRKNQTSTGASKPYFHLTNAIKLYSGLWSKRSEYEKRDKTGNERKRKEDWVENEARMAVVRKHIDQLAPQSISNGEYTQVELSPEKPWGEIRVILPCKDLLSHLIGILAQDKRFATLRLLDLFLPQIYDQQDIEEIVAICRQLPGRYRLSLYRWDKAAFAAGMLAVDLGKNGQRLLWPGIHDYIPVPEMTAQKLYQVFLKLPQQAELIRESVVGDATQGTRESTAGDDSLCIHFKLPDSEAGFTLSLENLPDWGWMLRLSVLFEPEIVAGLKLTVRDQIGRVWISGDARQLPLQTAWLFPDEAPREWIDELQLEWVERVEADDSKEPE